MPCMKINNPQFYNRHVVDVARDLIGKILVFGEHQGIITETEAYRGNDDEASHAHKGITKRSAIMYGEPGYSYVYLIYGMYHCLNIVTEGVGKPSAVLIRSLYLPHLHLHLDGPGKICRHLGMTLQHNGLSLIDNDFLYLKEGVYLNQVIATTRIGIKKARDKPWRFLFDTKDLGTLRLP